MIEVVDRTGPTRRHINLIGEHDSSPDDDIPYARYAWEETISAAGPAVASPIARDLIHVARSVHLADRSIRRSTFLGKRTRRIEIRVPVHEPTRWRRVAELVESLAGFASADEWKIAFVPLRQGQGRRKLDRPRGGSTFDTVALFSGGLDSLCGAAYRAEDQSRVLFVTHSPPGRQRVSKLLSDVWLAFDRDPSTFAHASFRLRPSDRTPSGTRAMFHEHSRRSRPFYFLALAAAIAVAHGIHQIQMSENGALALNLPYRFDAYGGTIARQAHSWMLAGFEHLLADLQPAGGRWHVVNPFESMTKGEACRLLGPAGSLAAMSVSCEYVGKQAAKLRAWDTTATRSERRSRPALGAGPQCGACLPCVVRRAALHAAELHDSDDAYFFDGRNLTAWAAVPASKRPELLRKIQSHPFYLRRFCHRLLDMTLRDFAIQFAPELRFATDPGGNLARDPAERFQLIRRYANELLAFLGRHELPVSSPPKSKRKTGVRRG